MLAWETQEAEVFTRMMLLAEIPATISHMFYFYNSVVAEGLFTINALGNLVLMVASRLFFQKLKGIRSPRLRFWCIFCMYQVVQVVIAACEMSGDQDGFVVNIISSTIVMMIGEVSPIHSTVTNGAIVAKHIAVWTYLSQKHMLNQDIRVVQLVWAFFDVLLAQILKKRILMGKQQAEDERAKEERKLKCLLNAMPDGILVISEKHTIVSYNPALCEQLKVEDEKEREPRLERVIWGLNYDSDYLSEQSGFGKFGKDLEEFMQTEVGSVFNFKPVIFEGKHLECRGCVTQWDESKAMVLTVRDSSNWVSLEKTAKLDSANKTALLRSVSHELRTPVNAILNLVQDLHTSRNISEQEKSDIEVVLSASNFLMSMINDLLDYSRILHDKFTLAKHSFELETVIRDCGHLIESQCKQKKIRFSVRYDNLLPKFIFTDENRLKQVILNLLSNAVK